ncbi:MAG TPA: ribonuclease Z [Rhabdochlamydiaceae bacterium]|nr:ribonuclease Z [Rhabdochlamydiaceae bacterium]
MTLRDLIILGCSSQQPTRQRNQGGYLLRWNGEGLLFDPGEGTQRQFIFANVAPTCVTRILISHFHGDHCLGLGSMLMRLNLDKVKHPIHCYYPASGKAYFDRLRYGTIYHETIHVIEHPVSKEGIVHQDDHFCIEAKFLEHGVENVGWRVTESDKRKFDKEKLREKGVIGPLVREIEAKGKITLDGSVVTLDDVSWIKKGDVFALVIDTSYCQAAIDIAKDAKILLCESTYTEKHRELAEEYQHMTAKQAALIAKEANAQHLILTHFSARYQDLNEFLEEARPIFPNTDVAEDFKVFPISR